MRSVPHEWANQAITLEFDFESKPFRAVLELFNCMEVVEYIYEGSVASYKNKQPREDSKQSSGWKNREDNPPRLQFLRRNELTNTRTNMYIAQISTIHKSHRV